ncbi:MULTISPECIES: GNAT family N-acetyltransferase [unclassified Bacillus (in: firmicutes)]|uniref:GNAT family N-acetyltransferase n=1 Tax=unclassified Bacillus (in: firmicutes) TaxID=185979 RepID=UPI000BF05DFA|nr:MULTISPECIES: GNAT family protein [unclassified Bacillus (in: firmicutes)]PEJ51775.1 GNAT family N-acetyltransferase [Bacillus sp. AFS002410]PEK98649.1 GNAT family N-acetyltransferase [Bacillus sp. AFS017336]
MNLFPNILTERLYLREVNITDTNRLFTILSREDVTKYYGLDALTNSSQVIDLIHFFREMYETRSGIRWGIIEKETNKLIGTCGFNAYQERNKRAEVGYEIHPDYWRKGYATEAVKALLNYGFDMLQLNRIGAIVYPENLPSQKLLEKIGFTNEGLLREYLIQGTSVHDTYAYSILRKEWVI